MPDANVVFLGVDVERAGPVGILISGDVVHARAVALSLVFSASGDRLRVFSLVLNVGVKKLAPELRVLTFAGLVGCGPGRAGDVREEPVRADSLSDTVSSFHHSSSSSKLRAASKRRRYSTASALDIPFVGTFKFAVASLAVFVSVVVFDDARGVGLDCFILAKCSVYFGMSRAKGVSRSLGLCL